MIEDQIQEVAQGNPKAVREGQEQIQEVLARSTTDWEFRQKLLSDPREAIAEHTGQNLEDIPETLDLVFIENEADATVVLPDPVDEETELDEDELEAVAGGGTPLFVAAGAVAGTGFAVGYITEEDRGE